MLNNIIDLFILLYNIISIYSVCLCEVSYSKYVRTQSEIYCDIKCSGNKYQYCGGKISLRNIFFYNLYNITSN